ncbi:hypothetical protein ACIPWE_40235 [Streptomyces sp. NPDC090073]|uniref:hypothetical protein n=1 Tax=Streptomyces sp. NPDC090073 TaxID=3365936 RepID=UPI00381EC007
MSQTTGVILATGAVTVANQTVFHDQPMDWRVPVATGLAAIGFSFAERVWPKGSQILAWTVLATVLLTRTQSGVPSPAESALEWWGKSGGSGGSGGSTGKGSKQV